MLCLRCRKEQTIRAHLIPQVFCKEVQAGKSHAAAVRANGSFHVSQSGTFDKHILCASCDGLLGNAENYAARLCAAIRQQTRNQAFGIKTCAGIDKMTVLRFCAGILWKYSITSEEFGQISLFEFQDDVSRIAYGEIAPPPWFDVAMLRLRVHDSDGDVFAYRTPLIDRKERARLYRFLLGGVLFFVKVHTESAPRDGLTNLWLSNAGDLRFALLPAQPFEEFQIPAALVHSDSRLATFLDRQSGSP